jgi:hypothetical protein
MSRHRQYDRLGPKKCQSRTLVSMTWSSGAARVQDLTGDLRSTPLIDLPRADSFSVDPQAIAEALDTQDCASHQSLERR